jgi:hypothetical protein
MLVLLLERFGQLHEDVIAEVLILVLRVALLTEAIVLTTCAFKEISDYRLLPAMFAVNTIMS